VELHVLGIDDARAGSVGHRQAIAGSTLGIGGVQENLAEATGSKDRDLGQNGLHLSRRLVVGISAHARERLIDCQPV